MALFRWPGRRAWAEAALYTLAFVLLALPFGLVSGLYKWAPSNDIDALIRFALIAMVLPAILEELVFRGPLLRQQTRTGHVPAWAIAAALIVFVIWHPLNTVLFMPQAAETFRDWRFLLVTAWLGLIATLMTLRTRSLWPAILFHWGIVLAWKSLLGAPGFL
ncbi:MAG: CPBP family glutamic-type intramembrane protease [Pseudomonadota bacterium]